MTTPLDVSSNIFDIVQRLVATFAYFIGAVWVLMNYVRNRTHVPRLQIDVKAEIITRENRYYLLAAIQVKNLGLSIIKLPAAAENGAGPYGSALMLKRLREDKPEMEAHEAEWDEIQAFEVLEQHSSIEPGLSINQEKLFRLPDEEYDAWWVRLRILAHGQSWSSVAIAIPPSMARDP